MCHIPPEIAIMSSPEDKNSITNKIVGIFGQWGKEMPQLWKNLLVFFITVMFCTTASVYVLKDLIRDLVYERPLTSAEAKVKAANERRIQEINDSIAKEKSAQQAAAAFQARQEMEIEAIRTKLSMEHCIGVNFYSIHNGGETIQVDGKWHLEVYLSTEPELETDFPDLQDDSPQIYPRISNMFRGWAWLNNEALKNQVPIYIPDVSKFPGLYNNRAKSYLDASGIKSTMVMLVENRGNEFLFVSFNFDVVNPHELNPDWQSKIYHFRRFVRNRI